MITTTPQPDNINNRVSILLDGETNNTGGSSGTSTCPELTTPPTDKYRYFNQPIEQIPGFGDTKTQILVQMNGGLLWKEVECLDAVSCIKLGPSGLEIERKKLWVLKVDTTSATDCPVIPTTECTTKSPTITTAVPTTTTPTPTSSGG